MALMGHGTEGEASQTFRSLSHNVIEIGLVAANLGMALLPMEKDLQGFGVTEAVDTWRTRKLAVMMRRPQK